MVFTSAGRACLLSGSESNPEQGDRNDASITAKAKITIPLGTQGGNYETQLSYGGYYNPSLPKPPGKTLAYFDLDVPSNMC